MSATFAGNRKPVAPIHKIVKPEAANIGSVDEFFGGTEHDEPGGGDVPAAGEVKTLRYILFGMPGSGKSTYFQQLMTQSKEIRLLQGMNGEMLDEIYGKKAKAWYAYDLLEGTVGALSSAIREKRTFLKVGDLDHIKSLYKIIKKELIFVQTHPEEEFTENFKLSEETVGIIKRLIQDNEFRDFVNTEFGNEYVIPPGYNELITDFEENRFELPSSGLVPSQRLLCHVPNSNHTTTLRYQFANFKSLVMECVDLGGHNAVRDDWLQINDPSPKGKPDAHVVVYFVSLTDHNKPLYQADNSMHTAKKRTYFFESLKLWKKLVNHPRFELVFFYIVFTHLDQFNKRYCRGADSEVFAIEELKSGLSELEVECPTPIVHDRLKPGDDLLHHVRRFYQEVYTNAIRRDEKRNQVDFFPEDISCHDSKQCLLLNATIMQIVFNQEKPVI